MLVRDDWNLSQPIELRIRNDFEDGLEGIVWVDDIDMSVIYVGESDEPTELSILGDIQGTIAEIIDPTGDQPMIRTLENYQQMVRMKQGEDGFDVPQIGEGSSFYPFFNYEIEYKTSDRFDFSRKAITSNGEILHLTNYLPESKIFTSSPNAMIAKVYGNIPNNVQKNDDVFLVKEMVSPVVETIKLIPFVDEDVSESVLITPNMMKVESPIEPKTTQFKTHDDITTTDATLKRKIESRILSASLYDLLI